MAAAELGADNRALHPDPRLPLRQATLQLVPILPKAILREGAAIQAPVWDDLIKTKVLDAVAPVVEARNRVDLRVTEAVPVLVPAEVAPKAAALHEIVAALLVDPVAAEHNPEDQAEIEVDQLQAAQPEAVATPALDDQTKMVV